MKVAVIMGSKSDEKVMMGAVEVLDYFGIEYEKNVVSAHRTPLYMVDFAKSLVDEGFSVVIAGAGGAAHLPGMVAAITPLPVIGVPIKTSTMKGIDSLYSIVQMPKGIPVASMAINGAANAGYFAVSILALQDKALATSYKEFKENLAQDTWRQQFED